MTTSAELREQEEAPMLPSLAPPERRERIAEIVLANESVSARDLASRFDVSVMTVHRDLDELERQGVLRKIRGGATPQPSSLFESNVRYRLATAKAEKETLARFALTLIEPGQAILLDDATTTLALARLLPGIAPLTVITNYLATTQLLHNAWKFSGDADPIRIEVRGERAGDRQTLVVRDHGIGFDSRYAHKLFTPLQRLHGPEQGAGHGLGLAIAERILQRHGGRITADSQPGDGATFTVELPAAERGAEGA